MHNFHHHSQHSRSHKALDNSFGRSASPKPKCEEHVQTIIVRAGETLCRAGDPIHAVDQVVDGLLRAEMDYNGQEGLLLDYFEPGATIGLSFVDRQPFTVIAVKASTVVAYDRQKLSVELASDVYTASRIAAFASGHLADVISYMRLRHIPDVTVRIASYLLLQFDRARDTPEGRETVSLQGTRRELALLLGTSSDLISAAIRTLLKLKVIEQESETRFTLCDRKAFEMLANPDH
jgi:CRP-like cAMP-binding protein